MMENGDVGVNFELRTAMRDDNEKDVTFPNEEENREEWGEMKLDEEKREREFFLCFFDL